ncbi:MAG: SDR family NAD(P)-dependent oxidoreductase [Desulfobacteraceae bacterium]
MNSTTMHREKDVAVVGIACRFPGAEDYNEYWRNLQSGVSSIREIPGSRWSVESYYSENIAEKNKSISKWCGSIDKIDTFDNRYFNISPREAKHMDPQQRIMLEETVRCIEDAGVSRARLSAGRTSFFTGIMAIDHQQIAAMPGIETDSFSCLGSYAGIVSNRISHFFDFSGVSYTMDAACASSMVAVVEARKSLISGESDYAFAAGISLDFHPWKYISFSKSRMLSPNGRCKTFDNSADGYVPGEGAGVLLLRRLNDARASGDHIYGIIKGAAVNHCGKTLSITAPSVAAQSRVIRDAVEDAGIDPSTIGYIEAHGTGTSLGDPIEIEALSRAFGAYTDKKQFCRIGSVKTNIGHLEAAAGVAGLIKVLLMMKHRRIPGIVNLEQLNPIIDFKNSPFKVARETVAWKSFGRSIPLRAGVSSFGMGGVNSHVILEAWETDGEVEKSEPPGEKFFLLSAKSEKSLEALRRRWDDFIGEAHWASYSLRDICGTLMTGREHHPYRHGVIVNNRETLREAITKGEMTVYRKWAATPRLVISAFSAEGDTSISSLTQSDALFKGRLDRILAQCATHVAAEQFCKGNRRGAKSEVEAFVVEAAMLGSILEAVPEIPCMEVRTDRIWPVLTTAGMISAPQVAAYLATGAGIDRMTLKRPRLALTFSEALGSLSPYRIDTAYVEQLFDGISVEGTELHRFVQKARIMYENQYTFRNYLAEWERVLWENGLGLQELIGGTGAAVRSGAESLDLQGPKRLLQLTVIAVSLSKLNLKWDLTQRLPGRGAFLELMDLIVDQVLEKNWLVDYLFSEEMTAEELAQMMERRQDRIDKTKAYRVLRKNSERLVEAGDVGEWIARVEEGGRKGLPVAPMSDRKNGKPRGSSEEPEVVFRSEGNAASAYRRVLLELWRCGADVRFEKIMPDGSFGKVQLPTYRFDKYYFWLKEKEKENNRGKLVSEDRERWEREPGEEISVEVYPLSRAIIQDHVITDEHIVPAAAMIAQARRICNSKNPSAEWDFADVYIIRPGIVRQDGVTLHGQIIGNSSVILKDQSDSVMFRAELVKNRRTPSGKIDLQDMEARMTSLSGSVYAEMEAVGYRYGKTLRTVKREGAFGDFQLFEIGGSSRLCFDGSEIAPELLDGIFQAAVIAALRENRPLFREKILVPYKIGRFCLFGAMDRTCYALFDNADFCGGTGDQKVSVSVYDEEGSPLATIEQMVFKRVNKSFLTSHKNSKPVHTIRCDPQDCGCHDLEAQDRPNPAAKDHRTLEGRGSLSLEKEDFHNTEEVEGGKIMEGFYGADAEQMLFFYRPIWKKQALTADEKKELGDLAVVFYDPWDKLSIDFLGAASSRYETVIKVSEAGPAVDPDGDFVLASDDESAYEALLRQVRERERDREVRIDIFYFWKSGFRYEDSGDMPESILKISHIAKPFFNLVKALARLKPGKKVRILLCTKELHVVGQGDGGKGFPYGILTGFKETVELENPEIEIVCVDLEERLSRVSETAQCLLDEASRRDARDHAAFRGEDRYVRQFKRMVDDVHGENGDGMPRLRRGGNYILAGGAGGICDHLLALLARQAEVNLIVLGRSEPTMEKQKRFREISNGKAPIRYLRADVTDYGELARVVDRIRAEFGPVNGVIHAGGIIDDQLIASKTWVSFDRVIAVKTIGTLNLDALTREDPLEFFVVFSSIVSVVGNFGQVDYAAGNSFVDAFIHYRRKSGVAGVSIAIDWPLWRGTGMGKGEAAVENFKSRELAPISPVKGVSAFQKIIREKDAGQIVVAGNEIKLASLAREKSRSKELKKDRGKLKAIESYLAKLIAAKIDFAPEEIDRNKSFFSMGVESIVLTEIMETLGKRYDKLPSTLLFEYPRVESLAQYLLENGVEIQGAGLEHAVETVASTDASPAGEEGGGRPADDSFHPGDPPMRDGRGMEAENLKTVAIIGMGCRMPEAGNMDRFFRNLLEKRDCIREVPDDRWNMAEYFREEEREGVFSYGKWGGFLDDVDKFDPLFFGITPREAGQMDPQQRILLENVWETMEHAGYGEPGSYAGRKIGLFVGMMWNDYSHLANQMGFMKGQYKGPGSLFWAVANRVSYEMNFRGPSMAVDTACSSSLTAVHLARQSILNGECDMAVAGGINLSLHPSKYVYLSQAKFLSKDGRCRSFGKGGTGYVPGEGVGCVLLKRLDRAVDEGDRIYGTIRGTSLNHGGKVTGFTVPSPEVQGELIADCLADAGMEGIRVDYVECHGTGTTLGDPIEIKGLKRAFEKSTERKQFCPVGSVKSNIGHLEAASGIAGIIKVLLSFAYDKIPGSIHAAEKNPYIDFADSPFYLLENTLPFKANPKRPRVAGVSSFGAGGSNAHVILEANDRMDSAARPAAASRAKYLIAISARTDERLAAYARKMIGFFSTSGDLSMDDVEYTLLFRRKSFEQRLAVVCSGKEQLIGLLDDYLCGKAKDAVFKGDARAEENRRAVSKMNAEVLLDRGTLEEIAAYWAIGGTVGTRTWAAEGGRIMALPTYPFARERYWLHEDFMEPYSRVRQNILGASIHPMLDRNASKFDYLSFEKLFVGDEFYLVDHIIGGRKVLPGVACLEMAYAAQKAAGGADEGIKMTRVSWEKILAPGDHGRNAAVRIDRDGRFELVSTGRDGATVRHCRGRVALDAEVPWMKHVGPESLGAASGGMKSARTEANGGGTGGKEFPIPRDMEALIRSCSLEVDRQVFYASLKQRGADYGPSFQTVQALRVGEGRAISHLAPPEDTEIPGDGFTLHPALMDGALQTVLGLAGGGIGGNSAMYLPLSVESVEIRSAVIGPCAVVAERSGNASGGDKVESFDIDVVDLQGNLLVQFRGFAFISVGIVEIGRALGEVSHQRLACFGNRWEPSALSHGPEARKRTSGIILLFDNGNEGLEAFVSKSGARVLRVVPGTGFRKIEDDRYTVASCDPLSYGALFETLRSQGHLPQTVVQVWQDHRGESSEEILQTTIYPMFHMVKAAMRAKIPRLKILYAYPAGTPSAAPFHEAMGAFAKTLRLENPGYRLKVVGVENTRNLGGILTHESSDGTFSHMEVLYDGEGVRRVRRYNALPMEKESGRRGRTDLNI